MNPTNKKKLFETMEKIIRGTVRKFPLQQSGYFSSNLRIKHFFAPMFGITQHAVFDALIQNFVNLLKTSPN
jgi:hypothetical protein